MSLSRQHFAYIRGGAASALVSFPISMTYGVIAFAPFGLEYTTYGILAGLFGAIFASIFIVPAGGRSMLGLGPRAASIVIFSALCSQLMAHPALDFPPEQKIQIVIAIGFVAMALAGLIQTLVGLLRFGSLVTYIPYSVISGFINASVLLIVCGQVWPLLGLARQSSLFDLLDHVDNIAPMALLPGLAAAALMVLSKRHLKKFPPPLVGLAGGTILYHLLLWVAPGLNLGPTLSAPESWQPTFYIFNEAAAIFSRELIVDLVWVVLPAALSMAALASFDTVFSLSALSELTGEKPKPNRELIALGLANSGSALLGGLISAGGLNRSKPAIDAGALSPMFHMAAGVTMLAALIAVSDWLYFVPNAVVGGMVLYVGIGLFDGWAFSQLLTLKRSELAARKDLILDITIILLVIGVALFQNLIVAVAVGTIVAVFIFIEKMSGNLIKSSGRGPAYCSRRIWADAEQKILTKHGHAIGVLKLQGVLFFGTAKTFEEQVDALIADGVECLILDFKQVTEIDVSGARAIVRIARTMRRKNLFLAISYVKKERRKNSSGFVPTERRRINDDRSIWRMFDLAGAVYVIGQKQFFFDTDSALVACESRLIATHTSADRLTGTGWIRNKLLNDMTAAELQQLRPLLVRRRYQSGDFIFRQNDHGNGAYFILSGKVDILLDMENTGERKRLQTYSSGAFFGEMSLLNNMPRSATAVARADTHCFHLDPESFARLNDQLPHLSLKLFGGVCAVLAERLQHANNMIVELES